jgi:carbon storage regulator
MLVLSRKKNESIMIGDDVRVSIVEIRGDKVRLGIEAPAAISVHRHEVYVAIKAGQGKQDRLAKKKEEPE